MKYFKVFNTENEYLEYIHSKDCITPYVITLRDSSNTWISAEIHDYSKDYFTIESLEDNNTITMRRTTAGGNVGNYVINISTDGGNNWSEKTIPFSTVTVDIATINSGEKIMFKYISGTLNRDLGTDIIIGSDGMFNAYGNVMSLSYVDFVDETIIEPCHRLFNNSKIASAANLILPATTLSRRCYTELFNGCTSLTAAPELPATTLAKECYSNMFKGCTSLTTAPELPATTTAEDCYNSMFEGCTSLTTVPSVLTATILANYCYAEMFSGCTALTTAPTISATTVGIYSCESMFEGCTSLTTPPSELPATTMARNCYHKMFSKCTALTTTPSFTVSTAASGCCQEMFGDCTSLTAIPLSLSATTLEDDCYRSMFVRCTSLTVAPELPATTLAQNCYRYMFMDDTALTTSPSELPATTLANNSYACMFSGCTALTTAPEICATTLAISSCQEMFEGCTSLEEAPEFHFTTVADTCCYRMFSGCTSLTAVTSELPATTLAYRCYYDMFCDCTALTTTPEICATTVANECCRGMFYKCTSLTTAPSVLPATTLAKECYSNMFKGCTSLTTAPELPATTTAEDCYNSMFEGCTSLITAPSVLPATTLEDSSYREMFRYCRALTTAPEICATTVADYSCIWMFSGCSGLTTPPSVLPATTLADGCYYSMFGDCTALTRAPELPATTLVYRCYWHMFDNSNVSYIKCLATDISATECTEQWLYRAPNNSGCTFVKASTMEDWTRDRNGIPDKWTIYNETYVEVTGVTISASEATVNKGNTYTLTATVLPSNANDKVVTWSTSDSSVATVVDGVVTGAGCGSAIITVTTHEGSYTAQCVVTVENHVTAVDLNTYIVTLATGNTYQLEAIVSPSDACDKSVTWTSNNTNVATVDSNGLVSGVTTGSVTVTVTSNDTNSATCNCSVTVNEGQHATGVTLSDAAITVNKDETYTLTATVLPIDAVDKSVTWSTSNSAIATVDSNGVVSGVASGDATVTVTTTDGGFTAQCSVSVTNTHDYSKDYFTIESLENSNAIKMQRNNTPNNPTLEYSLDSGLTWTTVQITGTVTFATINSGQTIIFKGTNTNLSSAWDKYNYFNASKQFKVYGNVMSLLNGDNFRENSEFDSNKTNHCAGLFRTTYLVDASNLILPAQTLYTNSYNGMFRGATALQHGPQMLATTPTGTECCASMFEGCINLEEPIEINFTTLAQQCCFRMFCMNRNSKITTPKMTKSPILRCNTAAQDCYKEMFKGNGNLNEITCLLTSSTGGTIDWVKYAGAATGTFYKSPLKNDWPTDSIAGIPTGWTVENYVEE